MKKNHTQTLSVAISVAEATLQQKSQVHKLSLQELNKTSTRDSVRVTVYLNLDLVTDFLHEF